MPDAHTNSAWDEVEDADQQQRVDQALSRLPHDQREVLLLFAEGAFEIEEIAKIVDKTPSDVQQLLDSARTQLREQLAEMFEPEPASV